MAQERTSPGIFRLVALGVIVVVVGLFTTFQAQADAVGTLDVTISGPPSGGTPPDQIDISGMTYAVASAALEAETNDGSATLPIAPDGFLPLVEAEDASLYLDPDDFSIAIHGEVSLLDFATGVEMLVTAVWENADDNAPDTAIFFSFGGVALNDLVPGLDFPLELTDTWLGVTTGDHTVVVDSLPADVHDFFNDGLAGTDDDFPVIDDGIAFRGVIDTSNTVIGDAAELIGLSGEVRLSGTLSTSFDIFGTADEDGDGTTPATALNLTATFPTTANGNLPGWFEPTDDPWELTLATEGTSIDVGFSGAADITVGDETFNITASVGFAYDGTNSTFTFSGTGGPFNNLFGQTWLDIEEISLDLEYTTADGGAFTGSLMAVADLEDLTEQTGATAVASFNLAVDSDGTEGSFELTTDAEISIAAIAVALGIDDFPEDDFDVTFNGFDLYVGFETSESSTTLTVALNASVDVEINDANIQSDILFRLTIGSGTPQFLVGIKPSSDADPVTVGQLLGDADLGDADLTLPQFTITISNATWAVAAADLDGPTAAYLGDGEALDIGAGVEIRAEIFLPDALRDAFDEIGADTSADIIVTGKLPLFGSEDPLSLTATFPTTSSASLPDWIDPTEDWVLSIEADGDNIDIKLSGAADITVGEETFNVAVEVGFTHDGTDATLTFSGTGGPFNNLFGQAWLDIEEISLDLEYTTADGGAFSGSLSAVADLEDLTGQTGATASVTFTLDVDSDGTEGSLELMTDVEISLATIVTAMGGTMPPGLNVTVDGFGVFVGFSSADLTIAVTTNVNIQINNANIQSALLFRLTIGSGAPQFLFGIKPADGAPPVTVGQLLGVDLEAADITLPQFTITIANEAWNIDADDLDGPTAAYLGAGNDLDVEAGVVIRSDIALPDALTAALGELGIETEGDLVLIGKLPFFGETELTIRVELPTIVGDGEPFQSIDLALFLSLEGTNVRVGIEGDVAVVVPRTEDPSCSAPYAGACSDQLVFDLTATLAITATGVTFDLEGGLKVEGGWNEPFGLSGLTIHELRVLIGVQSTPPGIRLGMLGRLDINDTSITVSFLLGVTATPPFIDPLGFTFAINSLGLSDVVALHEAITDTTVDLGTLPDIRLEDVFLAFGRVDQPSLCIRQGFFLTAELHIGGTPPGPSGDPPPCEPPPTSPPEATAACNASPSCMASILLDIQTGLGGGGPSVRAAGFITGLELGPLTFDPTVIELELSATTQRLYIAGGASLNNPFPPHEEWVGGSFVLELNVPTMEFRGEIRLADGKLLTIKVYAYASFDLDDPQFTLELEFQSELLEELAREIEEGFNQFVEDVQYFAGLLAAARDPDNINVWRNLLIMLQDSGQPVEPGLVTLISTFADIEDTVAGINKVFTDAGLPPPILTQQLMQIVLRGIEIPAFGGIPGLTVGGGFVCFIPNPFGGCLWGEDIPLTCLGFMQDGQCWTVPPIPAWGIPGLCDDPAFATPGILNDLFCSDLSKTQVVNDEFEDALQELGVSLPDGVTGNDVLDELGNAFTGSGVIGTCGYTVLTYGSETEDPSITDAEVTLIVHGKPVVFLVPLDLFGDFEGETNMDSDNLALQNAVLALLGEGNGNPQVCDPDSEPEASESATINLTVTPGTIDEGDSVTASGTVAEDTTDTQVTITWGDGTTSQATIQPDNSYSANHAYLDNSTYIVEATIDTGSPTAGSATRFVFVNNVAPTITSMTVTPDPVDEGSSVQVVVDFTDPGTLDTHVVEAVWSDGQMQTSNVDLGARTHTFNRTIVDDNPTGTPSDPMSVNITLRDKDGGTDTGAESFTVNNVAPTNISIEAIGAIVGEEPIGPADVYEGSLVTWRVSFDDVGLADTHSVTIDWGDGSEDTVIPLVPVSGQLTRTVDVAHYYADDLPKGTPSGPYNIQVTVTDDDTGTTTNTIPITVHNRPPEIVSIEASTTAPEEMEEVTLTITFTDDGLLDTHEVEVDWQDGTVDTYNVPVPDPLSATRTLEVSHTYLDDDPTDTPFDVHEVLVTVTDDDTGADTETIELTVTNVAPEIVSVTTDIAAPEEMEEVTLTITFTDVSLMDSHEVEIDWQDGTVDTYDVPAPGPDAETTTRVVQASHIYLDDDPTGTPSDVYTVLVTVTDDDTGFDTETIDLTVVNVPPVITELTLTPESHAENETDVTLVLSFTDVSPLDTHTITIDWGEGWTEVNSTSAVDGDAGVYTVDVSSEDARYTVVDIPALGGATLTATNRYGDNGVYTIVVTVVDDDTGTDTDSRVLTVSNVPVTHAIDLDDATDTPGGPAFFAVDGQDLTITNTANDPGSDDLIFTWLFGNGTGVTNTHLVGVPTAGVPDPELSPQVSPRVNLTDEVTINYADACLYGVSVHVRDDDGGDGGTDYVTVIIQESSPPAGRQRSYLEWPVAITLGHVSTEQLDCYLDIVGYLSSVFLGPSELAGQPWAPENGILDATQRDLLGVPVALACAPFPIHLTAGCLLGALLTGGPTVLNVNRLLLDGALMSTWLNFAEGAWGWDTPVEDTDGDGIPDLTFGELMQEVEAIRLHSSNAQEVMNAYNRLTPLTQMPASRTGTVTLQGRSDHSGVNIQLEDPSGLPLASSVSVNTGSYSVEYSDSAQGNAYVVASKPGYLRAKTPITLNSGEDTFPSFELIGGDANGDNKVDILDIAMIAGAYGSSFTPGEGSSNPDINGDGVISILDIAIAAGNYNKTGQ